MRVRSLGVLVLAVAACIVIAGCGGSSAAAQQQPDDTAIDRVLTAGYPRIIDFTAVSLPVRTRAVQARLGSCRASLTPLRRTHPAAARSLNAELRVQYVASVGRELYGGVAAMDERLARLHWSDARRARLRDDAQRLRGALELDTCADLRAWQRRGFAPRAIPAGTATLTRERSSLMLPVGPSASAPSSLRTLAAEAARAVAGIHRGAQASFDAWIKAHR